MAKRRVVVIGTLIALVVVGVILGTQCSSSPADVVDGPGMLYFYAEW